MHTLFSRSGEALAPNFRDERNKPIHIRDRVCWHKTRSGINWTRDEKRELLRRGYGRGRPFTHTEHYRKD